MGKHLIGKQKEDTKILYKKSNSIFCTGHSRTGSDVSQYTTCGILKTRNISRNNAYYTDGDKIKRDLSIETYNCILRRYYRRRMYSVNEASSGKTRCSTVADTELETGDEFKPDASACGDSRTKSEMVDQYPPSVDITSLMLENLKSLLNDWISKHILEDDQTKKKLIHALNSILKNLEYKVSSRTSCSTYVLDRNGEDCKVKNMKTATNPITCQYCKQKQASVVENKSSCMLCKKFSRFTIPFPYKHMRIISTLSIPRNLNKIKRERKTSKTKGFYRRNELTSDKRSKKVTIDLSSHKITPSKKRTVKARNRRKRFQNKRPGLVIFPELFYESTTVCLSTSENDSANSSSNKQNIQVETLPSLVKSIYADDPANVTSTDKLETIKTFTMTEANESHIYTQRVSSLVSNVKFHGAQYECCKRSTVTSNTNNMSFDNHNNIQTLHHSLESAKLRQKEHISSGIRKKTHMKRTQRKYERCKKISKKPRRNSTNQLLDFETIKYNQFTYLYRKYNNSKLKSNEFISHLQKVFKYFAEYKGKRNIKLEVHVDVFPSMESDGSLTESRKEPFESFDVNLCTTKKSVNPLILTEVTETKKSIREHAPGVSPQPEIIPLLDVAVSQSKYIFTSDNSTYKSGDIDATNNYINRGTIMTSLDVCKELHDLKVAIKDLSATTEQIMSEHLKWQHTHVPTPDLPTFTIDNEVPVKPPKTSHCKGIQISNTFVKGQLTSGLKLSKEPKKRDDLIHRLKKRSSSYHIIESESIIKVTDMTLSVTKPNELKDLPKKSQSLREVCKGSDQNTIAFFCDDDPNGRMNYQIVNTQRDKKVINGPYAFCNNRTQKRDDVIVQKVEEYQCHNLSSESMELAIAKPTILIRNRGAVTFLEGCLYCLVLWIPLIVIMVYFYLYVLDDLINPKNPSQKKSLSVGLMKFSAGSSTESYSKNSSLFTLKLSDIGF